jgi:MoaA/NifB/PqqE/SkfB family radical SAM enzyme
MWYNVMGYVLYPLGVNKMDIKRDLTVKTASLLADEVLKYIDKNPEENLIKVINFAEKLMGKVFPAKNFDKIRDGARDKDNVYRKLFLDLLADVDRNVIKTMLMAMGVEAGVFGTKTVRENREKYDCNIPWIILFDPTSACNLKCKGCWAAEYGNHLNLSNDDMQSIVSQGKALGTHFYMLTGGEPLIRKKDILELARNNQNCAFLIYTNATLIDEDFCEQMNKVGNITLALSIEGTPESNDARRGEGAYAKTMDAMRLLKEKKCLFGISVCYTSKNLEYVTSDEFLDEMVKMGVRYAFYFNYMPIGHTADKELIPTPMQRKYMYSWLRRVRNGKTGKPMFIMDFQDDGEFVGGCIAGGRNYFHINAKGDIEPCVFIHYSDSNIYEHTLLEALKRPLFTAFLKGQPFNDNHLRPCPMLENPDKLRKIVKETGAKSTDLIVEEDVETLCSKCDDFASKWKVVADELWNSTSHPVTHTQYWRDRYPDEKS